ncbi:thiamin pyrophosphokinase family protein [Striga asiatica]|uniref:thiamine diphosphokinase n=1 Tax=Striga asiatica TaxID=4170 RepID=A0A5A7NWQ8_STRAF|nr:thiamin pyrophosphokinase family protein [Striga asiatica]
METMTHSSTFLLPYPPADNAATLTYVLVVLNRRLPRFTPLLWKHAQLRICADGGANRLYDEMPQLFPDEDAAEIRKRYKPNSIKGDMDSVREEVLGFYKDLGTEVVDASDDQDTTDLHKCVAYIQEMPNLKNQELGILVAGALGGRFDHEVGNINVLCRFPNTRIVLLSDDCLIQLLPCSHRHEIYIQPAIEGPHCGLIPISGPSKTDTEMRFGGLISTSNIVKAEKVTVQADAHLLWTISINKKGMLASDRRVGRETETKAIACFSVDVVTGLGRAAVSCFKIVAAIRLPLSLLKTAQGHPMLVELKNGETYNGHLVNCDTWMNIHLREVICTSKDGDRFWRMPECYIRGNTIKYLRVPDEVIDKVQEESKSRSDRRPPGVGRGRGRGREDGSKTKGIGRGMEDGGARGAGGSRGRAAPGGRSGGNRGAGGGRGR